MYTDRYLAFEDTSASVPRLIPLNGADDRIVAAREGSTSSADLAPAGLCDQKRARQSRS
jgi:hypothetical protein